MINTLNKSNKQILFFNNREEYNYPSRQPDKSTCIDNV